MRVRIQHTTRLDYTADVVEAVTDTRLGPRSDADQRWGRYSLRADPAASVRRYTDAFGNEAHLVTLSRPHRFLEVVSQGEVFTLLSDPFALPSASPPPLSPGDLSDYLSPSDLVQWDDSMAALASPYRPSQPGDTFECVQRMMAAVHGEFTYEQDVTNVGTTVMEVMAEKAGVCQDFAHVMLALCRAAGIPARYISGYIVSRAGQAAAEGGRTASGDGRTASGDGRTASGDGRTASGDGRGAPSRGHGASHAWIEAFTPTHGWRGFDPTNNLVASEHHVKIAVGRDYRDVPPTRGTYRGDAEEKLSVEVTAVPS